MCYVVPVMVRRPELWTNAMSRQELAELNVRLSRMSVTALQDFYHAAHHRCGCDMGYFPNARAI